MLYDNAARQAGDIIWRLWHGGEVIDALPASARPATRADGYRIQSQLVAHALKPPFGWKIAGTNPAGRAHIGIAQPIAGRILAERVHPNGATARLGANRMLVAEAEFAFAMGTTLRPRAKPYSVDEVMAAVERLHPAIEIPDSRFADFVTAGEAQLVADNACAHEFVLGPASPDNWRSVDLANHRVRCEVVGRLVHEGSGRNVLDDPRLALVWLANELSSLDIALSAGQIVTTGTAAVPIPIARGDRVVADFGALGSAEVTFA